jgi:hypothetical protein
MGRHAIEAKLNDILTTSFDFSEPNVVYILVEIRKLLEISEEQKKYQALVFFCNWALHSKLDKTAAIRIVRKFDEMEDAWEEGNTTKLETARNALKDTLGAKSLRKELKIFLQSRDLPATVCMDETQWHAFLKTYGAIIHQAPLEFNLTRVKYISRVVVERVDEPDSELQDTDGGNFLFALKWKPIRFDKKVGLGQQVDFWAS